MMDAIKTPITSEAIRSIMTIVAYEHYVMEKRNSMRHCAHFTPTNMFESARVLC